MRRVREIVCRKNKRLGKRPYRMFVFRCVFLNLFENLAVRIGRRYVAFDPRTIELALVLEEIDSSLCRLGIYSSDFFPFLEEYSLDANCPHLGPSRHRSRREILPGPHAHIRSDKQHL